MFPIGRTVGVPVAAAMFLTLTDAFGLEVLPLGERFAYWLLLLGSGQLCSLLIRASLDRAQLSPARLVLAAFLRCVLVSLPVTVWLVTSVVLSEPLRAARLPGFYLPVLVVTAAMVCLNLLTQQRPVETHAEISSGEPQQAARPAPILARLPPRLRSATLYAVQAEDHYIRFFTSAGSDLVLLRFSDALRELRGIKGAQVHRSWWVARDAVKSSRRDDGKLFLVLSDGTKAPVSRSYMRALQVEGWL
jgi:DNA-binding LytR/AlgR family response regulator